mgnify:CR=1 FL=1
MRLTGEEVKELMDAEVAKVRDDAIRFLGPTRLEA